MTSLFIGGCADGCWISLPEDANHWEVAFPSPLPGIYDSALTPATRTALDRHTYRRERLGAPGKTWTVFVHEPLSMTEAMDKLLDNYRP